MTAPAPDAGRICFHLAECADAAQPFRFLATRATGSLRYQTLGSALQQAVAHKDALVNLMRTLDAVARESALIGGLIESGALFTALAWSPAEAHRFLREIKLYERHGVVVRAPEWCRQERLPRVQVAVKIGDGEPPRVGLNALLDFSVNLSVGEQAISDDEWRALRESAQGLVRVRGEWVEVDREEVESALRRWRSVERADKKINYADGVRLLSGVADGAEEGESAPVWSKIEAGPWLSGVLANLRGPGGLRAAEPGSALRAALRPYQQVGVNWLYFLVQLGLGACLADDMGLGKTVQILALLLVLQREGAAAERPHLLVAPASLLGNWQAEIKKFAPSLQTLCAHPSAIPSAELRELSPWRLRNVDLVLTTYGTVPRLPWLLERDWGVVILDEAQAIKNPSAKQSRAIKTLQSLGRIALTGTPVENRLADIWSLFDFINPGLLGSLKQFQQLCRQMRGGAPGDAADYAPLRELVRPYILRRLKSDKSVIADLPDKTELVAYCSLTPAQAALYQQAVDELAVALKGDQRDPGEIADAAPDSARAALGRRNAILTFLLRFKQICNHPSHWLGDQIYAPQDSGKFERLRELAETIAERDEKVLVFTQYRELCDPLADFLAGAFGRPGLVLHGDTPIKERRALVERFQTDAAIPFFVLSVKAGGTGLNLTAASHVIHFDRWWNPAAEDQATDRAYRIGQHRNVLVHKFVCRGTIEEKINDLIESKKSLSRELLADDGEIPLTEMSDSELINLVTLDLGRALGET